MDHQEQDTIAQKVDGLITFVLMINLPLWFFFGVEKLEAPKLLLKIIYQAIFFLTSYVFVKKMTVGSFVLLNSTRLSQPPDVAFYSPIK